MIKNNFYHFNIYFKKLRNLRETFKKYSIKILKKNFKIN